MGSVGFEVGVRLRLELECATGVAVVPSWIGRADVAGFDEDLHANGRPPRLVCSSVVGVEEDRQLGAVVLVRLRRLVGETGFLDPADGILNRCLGPDDLLDRFDVDVAREHGTVVDLVVAVWSIW